MAKYFNYFPKTFYSSDNKINGLDSVTNIIARFAFESTLKKNTATFYEYEIREGDTPEIIAAKYYDSPEKHWIVLLFNDIIDPQFDWPLDYRTLNKFIDEKYSANNYADTANTSISGLSWSKNNTHSYYKVITQTDNYSGNKVIEKHEVDANTYLTIMNSSNTYTLQSNATVTIQVTKETKDYYRYELDLNEEKRNIKLIKPEFVPAIEQEFESLMKETQKGAS